LPHRTVPFLFSQTGFEVIGILYSSLKIYWNPFQENSLSSWSFCFGSSNYFSRTNPPSQDYFPLLQLFSWNYPEADSYLPPSASYFIFAYWYGSNSIFH